MASSGERRCGDCTLCCNPDERIVRELEGTRVVSATVVKAGEIDAFPGADGVGSTG